MPIEIVPKKKKKSKKGGGGMDIGRPKKTKEIPMSRTMSLIKKEPAVRGYAGGGGLKAIPEGNKGKGLSKLPTEVRNKMGFMKGGGKVMKMRGGGMASRGLNFRMR